MHLHFLSRLSEIIKYVGRLRPNFRMSSSIEYEGHQKPQTPLHKYAIKLRLGLKYKMYKIF